MKLTAVGRIVVAVAAVVALVSVSGLSQAVADLRSGDFPVAVAALVQVAAAALSVWLLLVAAAGAARIRVPGVPRFVRHLLHGAAIGVVAASLTTPAHASTHHDLDGLPLPDRPVASIATPDLVEVADDRATVTVRAGDTLWALAAESLAPGAEASEVARACDAWYWANRATVGPDPDLILPGQVLTAPEEIR